MKGVCCRGTGALESAEKSNLITLKTLLGQIKITIELQAEKFMK